MTLKYRSEKHERDMQTIILKGKQTLPPSADFGN